MCGIVGVVGIKNAASHVLDGLRRLEYRGYDSAGIATIHEGEFQVRRRKGKLEVLSELLKREPLSGDIAIGHTRWATHGRPSDENAHPHRVDDVVVVHNGIIENYVALSQELRARGRQLQSDTDTELVAHLIAMEPGADLALRLRHALAKVHGAYALGVLSTRSPEVIVVAKNASPLVVGLTEGAGILASDIPALLPFTRDVVILEEGDVASIRAGRIDVTTLAGAPVHRESRHIEWSPTMAEKDGHKHFMHKEIHEQPRALADTLRGRLGAAPELVTLDEGLVTACDKAKRILFTACGTSWHACLVGRLVLEDLANHLCEVELASELRFRNAPFGPETLVFCVSQSGETADTLGALKTAKAKGSPVAALVNVVDSSIARASDFVTYTNAGPEIGVASTKAFLTQVIGLVLLAMAVAQRRGLSKERAFVLAEELRRIPLLVESVLKLEDQIIRVAQGLVRTRSALFLGRGYGFPVALEGALKLKEISYIHAEGYAAGEMKHGPIALIDREVPVVAVATAGPTYDKLLGNLQEVRARDGRVIAVATVDDPIIENVADDVLWIPRTDPILTPILATVPLQLLAYHVADARGTDIDQPRNLAKSVTVE